MTGIESAVPILAALDLRQTADFYARLGFSLAGGYPDYLIMRREEVELHFWKCDERHIAENTSCYLRVSDIDGLYVEFSAQDLSAGRIEGPEDREWGMREFYVWDPSGNLLRIGQAV
jgi:catechol 2,3-dioxygenase-like lactoylglutathione lyase family enzyme